LGIGDDIEESDSATFSVISVCKESTMPATVCAEVSSTGEGSETVSLQSHSSQASIPEEEISTWVDEMEEQSSKQQKLNEAIHSISGGQYSPVMFTLNTTWYDVSDTQQRYYIHKAKETIAAKKNWFGRRYNQSYFWIQTETTESASVLIPTLVLSTF